MDGINKTPWELRPEQKSNPKNVVDFKNAYNDHAVPLGLISQTFSIKHTHVVAVRLGCVQRPAKFVVGKKDGPEPISLTALEAQEREALALLETIREKKRDLEVRVDRGTGDEIAIYGLTPRPFCTTKELVISFLDGNGPVKLRMAVGKKELA